MKKQADIDFEGEDEITARQLRALNLHCRLVADQLNELGLDMKAVLKPEIEIPWSQQTVKEYLWRSIQKALVQKESTKDLYKSEVDVVYNTLNRHLAKLGVHVPFPSIDELAKSALMKQYAKVWSRKGNCPQCGVGTGSRHSENCNLA